MAGKMLFQGRRSSIEIIAAILSASRSAPVTKAGITGQVKINSRQMNEYLDWLSRQELIEPIGSRDHQFRIKPTNKGLRLLTTLESIQAILR